jgi:hypothetical protein
MSIDVALVLQGAVLTGQAAQFVIESIRRYRQDRAWYFPAWACIQVANACCGSGCTGPRPQTARTCGRSAAWRMVGGLRRASGGACPAVGDAREASDHAAQKGGILRKDDDVSRVGGQSHPADGPPRRRAAGRALWDCRGRIRRHPHGRHRRC